MRNNIFFEKRRKTLQSDVVQLYNAFTRIEWKEKWNNFKID